MHRKFGVAQQLIAFTRVDGKDRETDRGGESDRLVLNLERRGEYLRDPPGKRLGIVRMIAGRLQSEKLVAALARQKFAWTKQSAHTGRHLDEQ